MVGFRGLVEVIARKLIPSPSLYGAEESLKQDDIVARRRYWYWRTKFRRLPIYILIIFALLALCQVFFAFAGRQRARSSTRSRACAQIFPPDTLPQLGLVFIQLPLLFFVNFAIFFGPFLFFAVRQIRGYEPGDASWGVKIDDVRGQAEAKEEITRVITLWQSGEEFEKAGGKRERGLLFLGAPGTGKTMISKAIATNFNCPFVTIPGSGFAGMFIGMDAITVQFLAHKARKLAKKWGGQCIVFIDEIDAVGMRRQALGGLDDRGRAVVAARLLLLRTQRLAHPVRRSGDRVAGVARADVRPARRDHRRAATSPFIERVGERIRRFYPGFGMGGGQGGQALNQLLVVMDGIDEPPMFAQVLHQPPQHVPRRDVLRAAQGRPDEAAAEATAPARGADLLHRRLQRPDHGARPGADARRPDGPPHLVPDADQGRPARHLRPLPGQGRPRARPRHRTAAATSWRGSRTATRRR